MILIMNINEILDRILVPRPNGSAYLEKTADYLNSTLTGHGARVSEQTFIATPHGFQLMWAFAVLAMVIYSWAILSKRYLFALCIPLVLAVTLFLEFELQVSTISLLAPATERNVIGTWVGAAGGPTLIFTAHYDTTTHFGDHFSWGFWGRLQGPATGIAIALPLLGLFLRRRNTALPRALALALMPLAALPFVAMFWFQSIGPLVRTPSVGAIDNGGSMAVLLLLAQELEKRPAGSRSTVKIVFLAAEEERTLGSLAYAKSLAANDTKNIRVINLESIGTTEELAYIPEDGFATRRYRSSESIIGFVNHAAQKVYGKKLEARPLPFGTLTDGRSFLARSIDSISLRSFEGDEFPHQLHSVHDSRDRLSVAGLEKSAKLLQAIIFEADEIR
jgi:hypothetical protein